MSDSEDVRFKTSSQGLKDIVIATLKSVCLDVSAPAAAKAQAARTLAEIEGLLGKYQAPPTDDETHGELLSEGEIDAQISELNKKLKR
ncbi:hypothetical protein AVM02_07435 [Brucella anthropi]|uniref:hypothetical protein n=1 Tax=Brucella anthropi TaxID=529 RepID=UPI00398864B2